MKPPEYMSDIIKKDKKLAEAARKIFGDIVKTAYVSTYNYSLDKDNPEVEKRLQLNSRNLFFRENHVGHDAQTIFLEFPGGRLVGFTNSEWGGFFLQEKQLKRL